MVVLSKCQQTVPSQLDIQSPAIKFLDILLLIAYKGFLFSTSMTVS